MITIFMIILKKCYAHLKSMQHCNETVNRGSEISNYFEAMTSGLMTCALAGDVPSSLDTYTTFISFVQ